MESFLSKIGLIQKVTNIENDMKSLLFLTACVNPKGMAYTKLNVPEVRLQQYKAALNWYLMNTDFQILLVENSNWDFSEDYKAYIECGRLEFMAFDGNSYERSRGKGYGEAIIMEYGLRHSKLIQNMDNSDLLVKVTGRLLCDNLKAIVVANQRPSTVYANIAKDDWGGNICSSQFVVAPIVFWRDCFLPQREKLNDAACYHFEHLLYDSVEQWRKNGGNFCEFWTPPIIKGVSGTSGTPFATAMSRKQLFLYRIMYVLHRLGYRGYFNPFYHGLPKKQVEI